MLCYRQGFAPRRMQMKTYLVLAQYREHSPWADEVGSRYHFPKKYYNYLTLPNIQFVYFEPKKFGRGEFFGSGRTGSVVRNPENVHEFFAEILDYVPFLLPVSEMNERGQRREKAPYYNPQNAVRKIEEKLFVLLCSIGN